jgi:hypothetical protein
MLVGEEKEESERREGSGECGVRGGGCWWVRGRMLDGWMGDRVGDRVGDIGIRSGMWDDSGGGVWDIGVGKWWGSG